MTSRLSFMPFGALVEIDMCAHVDGSSSLQGSVGMLFEERTRNGS